MVIKGKARGSHRQLVSYMMGQGENEQVRLLHIGGTMDTTDPFKAMNEFALSQELTGSKKAFYHGQLSPAYEESMTITDEQYIDMVYRTAKHLGHDKPRVIITEHVKNGHKHIHFGLDRYDYDKGKLVSDSYNYYKHDAARAEIEQVYNLVRTPVRNANRNTYKEDAKEIWEATRTGEDFYNAMKKKGYTVAISVQESRPYRLIDKDGRNYNLVRQIQGIKTAEVRDRLKDVKLPLDRNVMEGIRRKQLEASKTTEVREEAKKLTAQELKEEQKREYLRVWKEELEAKKREGPSLGR